MVLSFAYQVILILCIFLFCSFCILLFAHSRQRKLNLFHLGTIFSISFVHLSLKNKKLNLFHPILNIGQGKGRFCQKNLKTRSIPSHFNNKAGQRPILSKESETRSIQSNFKYETQLGLSLNLLVSLDVVKGGRVKVDLHQLKG